MITQKYKQGEHEIKIESAESLEDAKKNNFREGEYTRHYINGKLTDNYMAMMRFIVDESKKNQTNLIPTGPNLMKLREEMFANQNEEIKKQLDKIKAQYGEMGLPTDTLEKINEFMDKVNPIGVRTKE